MQAHASVTPSVPQAAITSKARRLVIPNLQELNAFAVQGLVPMFDEGKSLFCKRLLKTERGMVRNGFSARYTIMCLLGLRQLEKVGVRTPFDLRAILGQLLRDPSWLGGIGDLGLVIWLVARAAPDLLGETFNRLGVKTALDRYSAARAGNTTEMAWFLTGLAHAALACPAEKPHLVDLAATTFRTLKENQGASGLFGHLKRRGSLKGILRGRIGSFADQVYPIYAFSQLAQAYGIDEALQSARLCAKGIIDAQGPLGQWWWLYDSVSGKVVRHYPVYSVHQEGMAPMALFALGEVAKEDFSGPIYKGLQWISGQNELNADLRDPQSLVIWRCLRPKQRLRMYVEDFQHFLRGSHVGHSGRNLKILYECWPYELGWLLYAFAGRHQEPLALEAQ